MKYKENITSSKWQQHSEFRRANDYLHLVVDEDKKSYLSFYIEPTIQIHVSIILYSEN